MSNLIEIPKAVMDLEEYPYYSNFPAWVKVQDTKGNILKPNIICNCGKITGIGLHHVHADGRVTASYFHTKSGKYGTAEGCEWHVFLKLKDYNLGEFKAVK